MARVLIVAKTRMGNYSACVGGLNLEANQSVRLLGPDGANQPSSTKFDVGQIWDIQYLQPQNLIPPHYEDVIIQSSRFVEQVINIRETLVQKVQPWQGGTSKLFGGLLVFQNGKGYISRARGIPSMSTGYWIPDKPLIKGLLNEKINYIYDHGRYYATYVPYVGFADPIDQIPAGTLVRISLARWWSPQGTSEERCYLQLSGWYL